MIRSKLLAAKPALGHAHSTRADGPVGPLRLRDAARGRAALVRAAGGDPERLVVPEQVHGDRVGIATSGDAAFAATDGLATSSRGVPLLVQGADCPLVLLFDERAGVVAVAHSGWRGTVARIAASALDAMSRLGTDRPRVVAAVFPGIGPCCYEVGEEVRAAFDAAFGAESTSWFAAQAAPGKWRLDLRAAIVATLRDRGVGADSIDVVPGCTACGGELYSHRGSRGAPERHGLCAVLV